MLLDLFAGPGGWDEGARMIGRTDVVGLEWDQAACLTAVAAGHARLRTDVAQYPTAPFLGKVDALIASPPCQAWSMAGQRKGEMDRANCHVLADRMAQGDDSLDWTEWEDPRSSLVCQPVRWVRDLRPPVIALEEVPQVQGLWEHFARIFRAWGYSTWVKVLCAADYGVPQTRDRVILGASLISKVSPPEPTHDANEHHDDLFGESRLPWVTMAQALGWGDTHRPFYSMTHDPSGGGSGARKAIREAMSDDQRWVYERPVTTVVGSFAPNIIAAPGYRTKVSRQNAAGSVDVSVSEGGMIQSFPSDYPWKGSKHKQREQIGNAVPPLLAAHVQASLGLGCL